MAAEDGEVELGIRTIDGRRVETVGRGIEGEVGVVIERLGDGLGEAVA